MKPQPQLGAPKDATIAVATGPGQITFLQVGVPVTIDVSFVSYLFDCNTGCYTLTIKWEFSTEVAVTYSNFTTILSTGTNFTGCGTTQTGACTPATLPALAPVSELFISSSDSCSALQQWDTLTVCWGYGSLGPYCKWPTVIFESLPTTPKACTPASTWTID
jgi:hypothetical protein